MEKGEKKRYFGGRGEKPVKKSRGPGSHGLTIFMIVDSCKIKERSLNKKNTESEV